MTNNTILVTGGCGYIGTELVHELLSIPYVNVIVYDNLSFGELTDFSNTNNLNIVIGDITDSKRLEECVESSDCIIHLAALVGDKCCDKYPSAAQQSNIEGARTIGNLAVKHQIKKLLFASTCALYNSNSYKTIVSESSKLKLEMSSYVRMKEMGENLLREICDGTSTVLEILRFASVFGYSRKMRFDLLINSFAVEAFFRKIVDVYSPCVIKPYLHVQDLVKIIIRAAGEDLQPNYNFDITNVGCSEMNLSKMYIGHLLSRSRADVDVCFDSNKSVIGSYVVDFSKCKRKYPIENFRSIKYGFDELFEAIRNGKIKYDDYTNDRKNRGHF